MFDFYLGPPHVNNHFIFKQIRATWIASYGNPITLGVIKP